MKADNHGELTELDVLSRNKQRRYVRLTLAQSLKVVQARMADKYDSDYQSQAPRMACAKESTKEWDDNTDLSTAIEYGASGWHKGQKALDNINAEVPALATERTMRRKTRFNRATGTPSVGRYLSGNPKFWKQRQKVTRRVVDLVVPIDMSCVWTAAQAKNRGLAVVALIEKLEKDGYGVNLSAFTTAKYSAQDGKNCSFAYEIPLKRAGVQTDRDLIMFAIAHPAYFRRVGFALTEYFAPDATHEGYGYVLDDAGEVHKALNFYGVLEQDPKKVYLTALQDRHQFGTAQQGFEFVRDHVAEILGTQKAA